MLTHSLRRVSLVLSALFLLLGTCSAVLAQNALYVLGSNTDLQLAYSYYAVTNVPLASKATGIKFSGGGDHTLALQANGTLQAWGKNDQGQLGDGTNFDRTAPVTVSSLYSFTAVAAGGFHSVALRSDGTVWAWGSNSSGQLGDGTTTNRTTPVQVSGLTGVIAIAAGRYHSLALKSNGTVWGWGLNQDGELGDTTYTDHSTPVQMNITNASALSCGAYHSLILKNDTTVWATGKNTQGQLGDGVSFNNRNSPYQVFGVTGVTAIAAGFEFSLALKSNNTIQAWGYNQDGQLGVGISYDHTYFPQTTGISGVTAIVCGYQHGMAIKNDGTVWAWGWNDSGRIGDGTYTSRSTPVQVSGLTNITAITGGDRHSFALKSDGTVKGWGSNDDNRLTLVGVAVKQRLAQYNATSTEFVSISSGAYHTLGLKSNGTVWAWGKNDNGQLGDGTTTSRSTPVQVGSLSNIIAVAAGRFHSLALRNDGLVFGWGLNGDGQLGIGNNSSQNAPVQMNISNVAAIAGGGFHSLMLKNGGILWGTGSNYRGQLADGSTTPRNNPVQNNNFSNVAAISAGFDHSFALLTDGTIRTWGWNLYGQLGDGFSYDSGTNNPRNPGLSGVTAISAGAYHSLAVLSDGTVRAWGLNSDGQLGDGTTGDGNGRRLSPVTVSGLSGAAAVAGAERHSFAVLSNGTVRSWGLNSDGQLGDGTTGDGNGRRLSPITVLNPAGTAQITRALKVTGGVSHSLILRSPAPVPTLTTLSQFAASTGSAAFTLTATGSNFSALDSDVLWNGTPLATVSRSATSIQATVPASFLTQPGSASVVVGTPDDTYTGGYATSAEFAFSVVPPSAPAAPSLAPTILSVKRFGNDVTIAFSLNNRGGQQANTISVLSSNVTLGALAASTLSCGTTANVNSYAKGSATFLNVPTTELQRFTIRGTYKYGNPVKTGSFAAVLFVKVP